MFDRINPNNYASLTGVLNRLGTVWCCCYVSRGDGGLVLFHHLYIHLSGDLEQVQFLLDVFGVFSLSCEAGTNISPQSNDYSIKQKVRRLRSSSVWEPR